MNKFLMILGCMISTQIMASTTAEDCKPKIDKARTTLLEMLGGKVDAVQQKAVADSANIADACIQDIKAPAGKEGKLADLKKFWGEFKLTREKELVPAILAGEKDKASAIGKGIQSERIGKVKSLIQQLGE